MQMQSLEELFKNELFDVYSAEKQITRALEKMIDKASDDKLAEAFRTHLEETQGQIDRLDRVCEMLDYEVEREKCEGMEGTIKEGDKVISECKDPAVCDAAMITAAQKVEHYEIASYGTLCALAKALGHDDAEKLLFETLEEERRTDEKLTQIAEQSVNKEARRAA